MRSAISAPAWAESFAKISAETVAINPTTRKAIGKSEAAMPGWSQAERDTFLDSQFQAQQSGYRARFPASEHLIVTLDREPVGRLAGTAHLAAR